jgi:hypothetical protein
MRYRILFLLLVFASGSYGQASDFLILKKRGKTIRSFYAGTSMQFMTTSGAYRDGLINGIRNDTLHIQEFLIRQIPTTLGTYINDTAGSFRYKYHYNQIASFGPPKAKFNVRGSGASLMGGGILLVVASGVVYLADREKFSPELMGAAAVLAGIGYLMNKSGSKGIIPGRKGYRIEYMDMTP